MKKLFIVATLLLPPSLAQAQVPVIAKPYLAATNNGSGAIMATNTFQQVFAASARPQENSGTGPIRSACTIQNNGTHTMSVFFGPIANATVTNSVQLAPSQSVSCNSGPVVLSDQVSITGTAGDTFYAAQQ